MPHKQKQTKSFPGTNSINKTVSFIYIKSKNWLRINIIIFLIIFSGASWSAVALLGSSQRFCPHWIQCGTGWEFHGPGFSIREFWIFRLGIVWGSCLLFCSSLPQPGACLPRSTLRVSLFGASCFFYASLYHIFVIFSSLQINILVSILLPSLWLLRLFFCSSEFGYLIFQFLSYVERAHPSTFYFVQADLLGLNQMLLELL